MKRFSPPMRGAIATLGPAALFAVTMSALAAAQVNEDLKLLPVDGAPGDVFGRSVAVSGSTVLVSADSDDDNGSNSGSAYLFDATTGLQLTKLLPADGEPGDYFGNSIAISGDIALVGAAWDDYNGALSGSAYLFDVTSGQQLAKLLATDSEANDYFGISVAISGDTALVGAHWDDDNGASSGSVYVFDVTTGQQLMKLLPTDGAAGDYFGISVAISGNTAIVGAIYGSSSGSAYLFDVTTGQQLAKLLPADGATDDAFGISVAISGNTALVGAAWDDDNGFSSGSAYVFDVTTGQQLAKLLPADGEVGHEFGYSVGTSDSTALVGAHNDDDNGFSSGSAYVFDVATGRQLAKLLPTDGEANHSFGLSVSISGTTALVGAHNDDDNGFSSGSAYVFDAEFTDWHLSPVNGNWFRQLGSLTWQDAEAQAQAWSGHLVTLRDQAENDWLASTFYGDGSPFWIGYNDTAVEGSFVWSSGESPGYENWRAGEPDDQNGADWAALVPSAGTWIDEPYLPERRGVVEVISDDCDGNNLPDAYEIGLQPNLDWNGDGVLDSCLSANYCDAAANSTGTPAGIGASGSPIASDNALTLKAWDLPLNEFAYFLASESTAFIPGFGGSSGNLCLGPPQIRFNVPAGGGKILNSGSTGTVSFTLDLNLLPQGITFDPGETWYFQLWYRDFTTGPTSNTTDGIEVMFR